MVANERAWEKMETAVVSFNIIEEERSMRIVLRK